MPLTKSGRTLFDGFMGLETWPDYRPGAQPVIKPKKRRHPKRKPQPSPVHQLHHGTSETDRAARNARKLEAHERKKPGPAA